MPRAVATAYGPPWDAMEGSGITSTGVNLRQGQQKYVIAVDPHVIPYGSKVKIPHNPFGNPNIIFTAADTGGAIQGQRIDFFVASGRKQQNGWGRRSVQYQIVGRGSPKDVQVAGQEGRGAQKPAQGSPGSTTTTKTITPGVDNSALRKQLMFQYLSAPQAQPFSAKNLQPANVTDPVKALSQAQSQGPDLSKFLGHAASGTNSLLSLAGNLSQAQDVAPVTKTVTQRTPGTPAQGATKAPGGGIVFRGVTFTPGIQGIGKALQKLGLHVGENPHFGGVSGGEHANYGYYDHYHGGAIDVTGPSWLLNTVANFLAHHKAQLGIPTSGVPNLGGHRGTGVLYQVPNHYDHLHVSARH